MQAASVAAELMSYWREGSTWPGRTLSPIMLLCEETDADGTLLAISQLATHHYALPQMWRAGSAAVTA